MASTRIAPAEWTRIAPAEWTRIAPAEWTRIAQEHAAQEYAERHGLARLVIEIDGILTFTSSSFTKVRAKSKQYRPK